MEESVQFREKRGKTMEERMRNLLLYDYERKTSLLHLKSKANLPSGFPFGDEMKAVREGGEGMK